MNKKKSIDPNARPVFQKWSEQDFLMKTTIDHPMHWLARLFYRALLQQAFRCDTRPNLPDDDAMLRNLLGGIPEDAWETHRTEVRWWFTPAVINGVKVLTHSRLQTDWQLLVEFREEQRVKGQKSGAARRKKQTDSEPQFNSGSTAVNQIEVESEKELKPELESELEANEENQPTNQSSDGGAAGSFNLNSNSFPPSAVGQEKTQGDLNARLRTYIKNSEDELWDQMHVVWNKWRASYLEWNDLDEEKEDVEDLPPRTIPKNGRDEMFKNLRAKGLSKDVFLSAWYQWIRDRYERDFDDSSMRIKQPAKLFADEFMNYVERAEVTA
jgi:hypothetical protein